MYGFNPPPRRRPRPRLLLFTYASAHTPHHTPFSAHFRVPVLSLLDVSRCRVPPRDICATMTGLDAECRRYVFQCPRIRQIYEAGRRMVEDAVWHGAPVALGVSCGSGTHRSVSFVERMARELRGRGWEVGVVHLDIGRGR
ncbi:uncharacterized protein BDZ99DRAFT_500317 [Mytilinidion resinicola]|uniref:RapZ C-terminal domain-containing protein n=1 Tax=Mytilinidion resinicola TaxID=574789 RepID=A0A6A6YGW2_9PEZI|nr:uncharacterized protein BDZ99DRAFT_500317 [Mytilinidion resinicola]KAF2808052.1 hypothetical protein BDZ99DRAFT_500317 [Mytilinidion resinicola]